MIFYRQVIRVLLVNGFVLGLGTISLAEETAEKSESELRVTSGTVTEIVDGDTFKYCPTEDEPCSEEQWIEVDLWGVDAPELTPKEQFFSKKASQYLVDELLQQTVILEQIKIEDNGKPLVKVLIVNHPNSNFNVHLLLEGYGWATPTEDDDTADLVAYREAEKFAREHKLGLWREIEPIAPREWLKQHADDLESEQTSDTDTSESE